MYEYQYRDHLGNLRVSYRQLAASTLTSATFATREQTQFTGIAENRDGTEAWEGNYSARVVAGVGPGKELSVLAGETVQMQVMGHVVERERTQQKRRWWPFPFLRTERQYDEFGSVTSSKLRLVGGLALPLGRKTVRQEQKLPLAYLQYVLTDTAGRVLAVCSLVYIWP
ncbi:hypothetical protein [uncultured Fibrella sp.]|uniref:hypothetical protein n=1 Tax=uncultured Fibrella sp. TaxID=1284596 RepID=UPI0035C9DB06